MTATPHNGKEEDFQLFMALLDGDRFEGKFRGSAHKADTSDLMRRMVKESLLKVEPTTSPVQPSSGTGAERQAPTRYFGSVVLDADRIGRDAGRLAEEVVSHLTSLVGATVRVTLEIEATVPNGAPTHVVRTVLENGKTLKFESQGFE